jgi:hypothetical protein
MDQAVTRRPLTGALHLHSQARPCGISVRKGVLKMLPECVRYRCQFIVSGRKGPNHPGYIHSTPHTNPDAT